jgi:uncharacterized OB-fold protein
MVRRVVAPLTEGLFSIVDGELTLIGGRSPSCGMYHFPLGPVCPYHGTDDIEAVDLPRTARLRWWTAVTAAPPGYHGPVPYGFGVVELDCDPGLRIIGRLTEPDPSALEERAPMAVAAVELPDGDGGVVVTWAFTRSETP